VAINAQAITPNPATWAALATAAGSDEALTDIQGKHERGQCSVLKVTGSAAGYVVVWMERDEHEHQELVLALGVGVGARRWIPWALQFARNNHANSVRTHCKRAGLIRLYQQNGFKKAEIDPQGYQVMRFNNGR